MKFSPRLLVRTRYRWAILIAVGLLCLVSTAWVTREISVSARDRLEQRFMLAARQRAELIVNSFHAPLDQLSLLQRLFNSVRDVEWPVFEKFVEPMLGYVGVRGVAWLPAVNAADRGGFEQLGQALWGKDFSIVDLGSDGNPVTAALRDTYYPVFYSLPLERTRRTIGVDVYSLANRRQLIDQTVAEGSRTSSEAGSTPSDRALSGRIVSALAPVYRFGVVPPTREERRANVLGLVVMALNIEDMFVTANASAPQNGLRTSLFDYANPSQRILQWSQDDRPLSSLPAGGLTYSQNFELGSRIWMTRVEASPEWLADNAPGSIAYIPAVGLVLTLLLLVYLNRLMGRLVDTLEIAHVEDQEQRRQAEVWADKLSMAVEQNPAMVMITDPQGGIEYVNKQFIETTGYSREEAVGQNALMLRPESVDDGPYRAIVEATTAGRTWHGEVQSRRRDGSLIWERMLIAPVRDRTGAITNHVAIMENITELRDLMHRLQESENRFRGAVSVMVEGLAIISPDGVFIFGNQTVEEYLGFSDEGLQGLTPEDALVERLRSDGTVCPPDEYPTNITLRDGREVRDFVMGLRASDGNIRWVLVNTSPLGIGAANRTGVVMTFSDITERRRAEEQLKLAFEAIRQSGEGILMTDADQRILSANPAFESVTGYSADEVIGKTPAFIASARHDEHFFASMREVLDDTGHWQGEVWNQRKNGEIYPEWLGVSVVQQADNRPRYYVYIFSDMTERQQAQQHIEFLAHHDPLTGLPNRLLLRDRVLQAQAQATRMQSRVALMYLDLDRFKTINDSLGHPIGDAMLKEVVERLKGCVRDSDTISRQGGDEFIILLNDVRDSEAVSRVADKIHQRMGEAIAIGDHSLLTSFSIGVALFPDDGEDFDSLLQKADTAMYHAKAAGRNGHRFFTPQMNQQVVEHLTLETQLRRALANKEFVLHYQPQLDLQEGKIIGVEALIRWNSPEQGLVSPARFIPVAEDSGLIVPIGAWVLGEACRQARAWQDAGLQPFVMAVNLSAMQFRRLDLVNTVINALVLSDLDSQWLELELTESILIQDAEATLDTVRRLKALGVKLSVDDFGTGYSSLTYLKRFAVDKLKIDQSFIRDLVTDPDDAAIVRAIIQMAHSLKLTTIAEGVETEELSNLLRLFHCDEIQGYWFARPMPADQLEMFVREHQARGN